MTYRTPPTLTMCPRSPTPVSPTSAAPSVIASLSGIATRSREWTRNPDCAQIKILRKDPGHDQIQIEWYDPNYDQIDSKTTEEEVNFS